MMRPMIPSRQIIPTLSTRPFRPIRPMKMAGSVRPMRPTKQMRLARQIRPTRLMGFIRLTRPECWSKLLGALCLAMFVGPKMPMPIRPTRNNKINVAVAANVSVGSNASSALWVDMTDANGSNDGKFNS